MSAAASVTGDVTPRVTPSVTGSVTPPVTPILGLTPRPATRMAGLPKMVLADPVARRWAALYDAAGDGYRWDQRHVEARLDEAMTLLRRVGGPLGPKMFGNAWPSVSGSVSEAAEGEEPVRVTAAMVSQMEDTLHWPTLYLAALAHDEQRRVLQIWLRCRATGFAFEKALRKRGIADSTGRRRRWQATLIIAAGLMDAGIPAPPEDEALPIEGGGWAAALGVKPAEKPAQAQDEAEGPTAPDALWEAVSAALAKRRPYESPRQIVNALLFAQVKLEFAGQELGKRLLADMETRRRQLRVLARRRGFLDDGGPTQFKGGA